MKKSLYLIVWIAVIVAFESGAAERAKLLQAPAIFTGRDQAMEFLAPDHASQNLS